jgi:hypothetical protein
MRQAHFNVADYTKESKQNQLGRLEKKLGKSCRFLRKKILSDPYSRYLNTADYSAELYTYNNGALDLLYTFVNSFQPEAMFGFAENDLWLIGKDWETLDAVIYRYQNGEAKKVFSQPETNIEDMWGTAPDNLFAVGHQSDVGDVILRVAVGFVHRFHNRCLASPR